MRKPERRLIEGAGATIIVPLSKLRANPSNPRVLRDERFAALKKSIEDFPDMLNYMAIVAVTDADGKYLVLGGNMRLRALQDLGIKEAPVMLADHWNEEQRREFVIKDNVGFGDWDWDALADDWDGAQLQEWGLEIPAEFGIKPTEGLTDPDDVPEVPAIPVTVLGDVWMLGKHRIVCGDSTRPEAVAKCLNGVKPHLMVTDPPYGVKYDPAWREKAGVAASGAAKGKVLNDDNADWREAWALFPGDVAYVWHAGLFAGIVGESLAACDFRLRSQIIWDKGQLVLSRGDYHWEHEPCWYAVKNGANGHWSGDRKQTTVWRIAKPKKNETGHGTQKPVECMLRPIENNSSPGQAVYEPFCGSGTTIIAGEMIGRAIHAIELAPEYVDVSVKRWQEFTGQQAIHEATGKTFAETEITRLKHASHAEEATA